jgi:sulfatase maturation enzyme AslB (radical SAM superfamily)
VLDLKLGNTCNLKCRTCNPDSSSSWVTEWYDVYHNVNESKFDFLQKYKRIRELYSPSNENLWKTLEEWIPKCVMIDFYGGEPLLVDRSWKILQQCVVDGYSKEQEIHYNTNATIFLTDVQIEMLKNFKQVNISLSIDGIEGKFEYMRYPAKWDIVAQNIQKYADLCDQYDNIRVDFCYTVSIMNIWDVVEFDSFIQTNYPNLGIYYNMLFTPKHFSITMIPENTKEIVSQRLLNYSPRMQEITNMLFQEKHDAAEFGKLFVTLERHDKYRNNYFNESFPEWHSVLVG